jgi:ABC-2 type transport system permease protein
VTKSEEALAPITNSLSMPLLLLSGIFLPMSLAPDWLRTISQANPLLYAVDAVRAVFLGQTAGTTVVVGLALFAALSAFTLWGAGRAFGRAVS